MSQGNGRCPRCGTEQSAPAAACTACGYVFALDATAPTSLGASASTSLGADAATSLGADASTSLGADAVTALGVTGVGSIAAPAARVSTGPLSVGQSFGTRYHIIRLLGAGGMGVVYQAWDSELNVAVAVKVIRPEVLADPGTASEVERRFKRELVLARQVTHRNVVRIHDLGEKDGIKYLTMPFVEGRDLATVLRERGTLPVAEALAIARQIAHGLAAAHEVGVVHRDLKPENIMLGQDGTALIMDFGISRSMSGTGTATALGAVVGTLEYMAPEQAQGLPVDPRADIYAFGLILYDVLGGRQRITRRENPMSEMMSRMQQGPPPLRQLDANIPDAVERVVARCLEPSAEKRFQSTAELVAALDALAPDGHRLTTPRQSAGWLPPALAAIAVVALSLAGWFAWKSRAPAAPAEPPKPVSVLIANFDNPSGDPLLDGLVEQALAVGVEGASFVSAYPRRDAVRAMERIRPGAALTEDNARLLAMSEGIDRVVAGSIAIDSGRYRLAIRVVDPGNGRSMLTWDTEASGKDDVLNAVGRAAAKVRNALGDDTIDPSSMRAEETFTAASLEAAHAYVQAQELQWAGKYEDALLKYREAVQRDPELGRAYAGMGAVSNSLGRRAEAEQYYRKALELSNRMTDRERYRTRSGYYLLVHDTRKADDELQALIRQYPADSAGLTNLALVKFLQRDMPEALDLGKKAAAVYPKNVLRRNNYALYAMYAGEFATAKAEAANVLQLNPGFAKAYVATALAQTAGGDTAAAAETWKRLQSVSAAGRDFAALGQADLAMYEGRLTDAGQVLEAAIATPTPDRSASTSSRLLVTLAELRALQGRPADAAQSAEAALNSAGGDSGLAFLAARALLAAGRTPRAADIAKTLGDRLEDEPRMYSKLIEGEIELARGESVEALGRLQEAQAIADSWIGRLDLGRVYLAAGKFAEADSEFDRCITRRGEATAALLDDIPTYRWLAPVYYYSGLAKDGMKAGGGDAFKTFLMIKQRGDEQGIVADARRRLNP